MNETTLHDLQLICSTPLLDSTMSQLNELFENSTNPNPVCQEVHEGVHDMAATTTQVRLNDTSQNLDVEQDTSGKYIDQNTTLLVHYSVLLLHIKVVVENYSNLPMLKHSFLVHQIIFGTTLF
jgi:hypothetical protein